MVFNFRQKLVYRILWDQILLLIVFSTIIFFTYDNYSFKKSNNLKDKIVNCIYFSAVTQFTIGYGGVIPITNFGKITNIIHNFISYFLLAVEISAN